MVDFFPAVLRRCWTRRVVSKIRHPSPLDEMLPAPWVHGDEACSPAILPDKSGLKNGQWTALAILALLCRGFSEPEPRGRIAPQQRDSRFRLPVVVIACVVADPLDSVPRYMVDTVF
jgi:hypothetical protein